MNASWVSSLGLERKRGNAPAAVLVALEWFERFSPSQGWATYLFLLATLLIVARSVLTAEWVETPGILSVMFWASIAGLILAKVRLHALLLLPIGLAIGFLVVLWKTSSLIQGQPFGQQIQEVWTRMGLWYEAASSGGISTDLLPFTLGLLVVGWVIGFVSAWFVFRRNNVWWAVVLGGTGLLTNLSFLPDRLSFTFLFFLFVFFAILLVARMSIIQRQEVWRQRGIRFSALSSWLTLNTAIWLGVAAVLLAALLPMNVYVSRPLATIWRAGRAPIENLEDEFARLFSGITSRKDVSGRFFGDTLPFQGKISFGGEVVMWADTEYPSYWLSRTYSEYSSQGWIAGETEAIEIGPEIVPPPHDELLKRLPVGQSLQLTFGTSSFLSGGDIDWLSRNASLEALAPKEFKINIADPSDNQSLPDDVQKVAAELGDSLKTRPSDGFIESHISKILPSDMVLVSMAFDTNAEEGSLPTKVTVSRKESITPDIVSWKFNERTEEGSGYSMVSFVSVATDEELREANTDYSGFIKDHYLQLPATVPQRVSDLATRLTQNANNPLDKARAIESYLRGPVFTYSQDIDKPPSDADGVDHFLFETQTGYSDYFASSMTVMLRAAGVPARMAAGYAPGEYEQQSGYRVVRDSDSHGWVQVYFPRYGWIDFEPTKAWPTHDRRMQEAINLGPIGGTPDGPTPSDIESQEFFDPLFGDEDIFPDQLLDGSIGSSAFNSSNFLVPIAIALGMFAVIWIFLQAAWTLSLIHSTAVEKAYAKMSRLGTLAGISRRINQTPIEYADSLGSAIPNAAPGSRRIAWAFTGDRYGRQDITDEDQIELEQAWKSIRLSLFVQMFKRLLPTSRKKL